MLSTTTIPQGLVQAFLETHYHVQGDVPTILKVGEPNPVLATLHETAGTACSAFVTACNPFSEEQGAARNAALQQALAQALQQRGLQHVNGIGQHPTNGWPGEKSFLVLGLDLEDAKALGTQLGQNAIVWAGADAMPRLILLR